GAAVDGEGGAVDVGGVGGGEEGDRGGHLGCGGEGVVEAAAALRGGGVGVGDLVEVIEERGVDAAGADDVDADAARAELEREGAHHRHQAALRGGVDGAVGPALEAGQGGDGDDGAFRLDQRADRGPGEEEGSAQVDRDRPLPVGV